MNKKHQRMAARFDPTGRARFRRFFQRLQEFVESDLVQRAAQAWEEFGGAAAVARWEEGRRLASEREDLIAEGVDPAEPVVPRAPGDPS